MLLVLSYSPTISLLVELLDGIFCLLDKLVVAPLPKVKREPVWPLQSLWVWWEALTYQQILVSESANRVRCRERVEFRYLKTLFNFPQLSSSGCLTQFIRNAIVVCILCQTRGRKRSWAVVWWNAHACSSGRCFASSWKWMLKRWSASGMKDDPVIVFGKGSKNLGDVGNHVKYYNPWWWKIDGHPKIIMAKATSDIELLVCCVVPSGKPFEKVGDNLGIGMTNE